MRELREIRLFTLASVCLASMAMASLPHHVGRSIDRAFEHGDYERVIETSRERLRDVPNDRDALYAKARALAMLGELDVAAEMLMQAVHAGYRNFTAMRQDEHLAPLREHETYRAIIAASEQAGRELAERSLNEWMERFEQRQYRVERDEERRLIFVTALGETAHSEMRSMLQQQADHLLDTLFDVPPDYDVLIAIPTPRDARRIFPERNVGGSYEHRYRRLISRDTGGSLRHEFFHVMHYGHMEQLGQSHRLWVQEGLASLYEDYELTDDGIRFLPNERNEITRNRARINRLIPWQNVFTMPTDRFMARATVLYPQARSMFEFVAAEGKLQAWYAAYVDNFSEDPTGERAFEVAFGQPISEIEQQWRQWVREQPKVQAGEIQQGRASLGIGTVPEGVNDGVLITQILPGSTASESALKVGDVLVALEGRSTTTLLDIRRILHERSIGEEIEVRVRRGDQYDTMRLKLRSLTGN